MRSPGEMLPGCSPARAEEEARERCCLTKRKSGAAVDPVCGVLPGRMTRKPI
jgi:hypothetical protein